jgi:hypothetical protein
MGKPWRLFNSKSMHLKTFSILLYLTPAFSIGANTEQDFLFNGKDLRNWETAGKAEWRVEDGVIVGGQDGDPKRSGILTSKASFKDFDLRLEYKIDEHGKYNSGIYFRKSKTKRIGRPYQLNLGRGVAGEYVGLYLDDWLDKGDEKDEIRKPRQWNKVRLLVVGNRIQAWLNDQLIVDYTDPKPRADLQQAGSIAFQTYGAEGHAGWVKFRNLKLIDLSAKEQTP